MTRPPISHAAHGENHYESKLTAEDVLTAREAYARWPDALRDICHELAAKAGCSYQGARHAVVGKTWRHLNATPRASAKGAR